MNPPRNLTTVVAGSFKFKPEVDQLHEEFADHGVTVLEPSKGWLWSRIRIYQPGEVRPLPTEIGLDSLRIEDRFIRALIKADFVYVNDLEGYMGEMTAFEIGNALGSQKPIYAREPFDTMSLSDDDLERSSFLKSRIVVASIAEIVQIEESRL